LTELLRYKNYVVGKSWIYKIDIEDGFYVNEDKVEEEVTSFYIRNEILSKNEKGNSFVMVEFSSIQFGTLPQKIVTFLNKVIGVNNYYVLELNTVGQIIDIHLDEDVTKKKLHEKVYQDEFFISLENDEKQKIKKNMERLDAVFFKNNIKKNLILLFCYPGYFRGGLATEFATSTHQATINSNFLKDVEWDVHFSMNLYEQSTNKETINLVCTGDVYEGTKIENAVLYQKIHNHFDVLDIETYTDYTFMVMSDYKICPDNFYIKNATIDICETLNEESIEFNKCISINLSENFTSIFKTDYSYINFKNKFIKPKRVFDNN
jgi:hypothetical protein